MNQEEIEKYKKLENLKNCTFQKRQCSRGIKQTK